MYLGVIRSRPTAYSKVSIQHNHLNRQNITQNKNCKCKKNIKLICLTFIYSTCKFEKYKHFFLSENYEQTLPNKKHKKTHRGEGEGVIFPTDLG